MTYLADEIAEDHLEKVKSRGDYLQASCPFHSDNTPSFWVHRESGRWGCFSCQESGSDLGYLLKAIGAGTTRVIQQKLKNARENRRKNASFEKKRQQVKAQRELKGVHTLPEALLGVYDFLPMDLIDNGFEEAILNAHQIGYDRGNDRITFPIRDFVGQLIGISGRATEKGKHPKYKVYTGKRIVEGREDLGELGEWFPDYSSSDIRDHLWRAHLVFDDIYHGRNKDGLIIVEGYKACLWLVQLGFHNVVALMGAHMSATQERLIRKMGTKTWILLDANEAGQKGTANISDRLGNASFPVYACHYPSDCPLEAQPDDFDLPGAQWLLDNATRATGKAKRLHVRTTTQPQGFTKRRPIRTKW